MKHSGPESAAVPKSHAGSERWHGAVLRATMAMLMNHWTIPFWGFLPALAVAGAGLAAWGATHPSAQLFGPTIRRTPRDSLLALTFDDGPNPLVTYNLLNLLNKYDARATFFLLGRFVRSCPALTREIAARGHAVCNHTDTHPNLLWLSRARISRELTRCQEAIAEATGRAPLWMRPPYGFRGPQLDAVVRQCHLRGVVMWSVLAYDWKPQPASRLIARLQRVARGGADGGDILVLHDGDHRALGGDRQHVVEALAYWLPRWRDAGLEFATIDEVIHGDAEPRRAVSEGRAQ